MKLRDCLSFKECYMNKCICQCHNKLKTNVPMRIYKGGYVCYTLLPSKSLTNPTLDVVSRIDGQKREGERKLIYSEESLTKK